jgi:uncharacterized membrane protein YhaH (DUF805 family)
MQYYLNVLKNYINITGRTGRKEFWIFMLINLLISVIAQFIDRSLGLCFKMEIGYGLQVLPVGYIYAFYALATLVPTLAVQVRRLHDVGKSGWFIFMFLIPVIGAIWILVLYCSPGKDSDNFYGAKTWSAA